MAAGKKPNQNLEQKNENKYIKINRNSRSPQTQTLNIKIHNDTSKTEQEKGACHGAKDGRKLQQSLRCGAQMTCGRIFVVL